MFAKAFHVEHETHKYVEQAARREQPEQKARELLPESQRSKRFGTLRLKSFVGMFL